MMTVLELAITKICIVENLSLFASFPLLQAIDSLHPLPPPPWDPISEFPYCFLPVTNRFTFTYSFMKAGLS